MDQLISIVINRSLHQDTEPDDYHSSLILMQALNHREDRFIEWFRLHYRERVPTKDIREAYSFLRSISTAKVSGAIFLYYRGEILLQADERVDHWRYLRWSNSGGRFVWVEVEDSVRVSRLLEEYLSLSEVETEVEEEERDSDGGEW